MPKEFNYVCEWCGSPFTSYNLGVHYCSRKCKWNAYYAQKEKKMITCKECGKEFYAKPSKKRVFCSNDCSHNWKRKQSSLIFGVGINDVDSREITHDNRKSYITWRNILSRCYNEKIWEKRPTYQDCSVCDEWKYFSNFKRWFDENYVEGYHLDKDILVQGNREYSPSTCCFVPPHINVLFTLRKNCRGKYPLGVMYRKDCHGYAVTMANLDFSKVGKYVFKTVEEARKKYEELKYAHIKEVAEEALSKGEIDNRIYEALLNYKIPMY